jgi:hypothetical protein
LEFNQLTGTIPLELGEMGNLRWMYVAVVGIGIGMQQSDAHCHCCAVPLVGISPTIN